MVNREKLSLIRPKTHMVCPYEIKPARSQTSHSSFILRDCFVALLLATSALLQAITNWHGSGWKISYNNIEGLYVLHGGGIGIFIGSVFDTPANYNLISHNTIEADVSPDGEYSISGIGLMSDTRWDAPGRPIENNTVIHNNSCVTGWWDGTSTGIGFEFTDGGLYTDCPYPWSLCGDGEADVTGNKICFNDFRGSTIEIAINPPEAEGDNIISRNLGENRGHGVHQLTIYR